jgi:hypothetical protein
MKVDRDGVLFKSGTGFYWPFPRLRYRLQYGHWCTHERWEGYPDDPRRVGTWEPSPTGHANGWTMVNLGLRQMRRCYVCKWVQWR